MKIQTSQSGCNPFLVNRSFHNLLTAATISLAIAPSAQAANATWTGTGGGTWNSGPWSAATPGAGDTATFNNAGPQTINVAAGQGIQSITFTSGTLGNFTFDGGSFALGNGGNISMAGSAPANSTQLFNSGLLLSTDSASTYNITQSGPTSGQLNFSNITGQQTVGNTSTITFTGSGGTTFTGSKGIVVTGVVSDGANGGKLAVLKSGATNLFINGASTYTGATTIGQGTVYLSGTSGKILSTSGVTVSGGGRLQIGDSATPSNNNGVTGRVNNSATVTLGGPIAGATSAGGNLRMAAAADGSSHDQTLSTLQVGPGYNTLDSTGAAAAAPANLTVSNLTRSAGGVLVKTAANGFNANFVSASSVIDGILVGAANSNNTFISPGTNVSPSFTNNIWSSGTHTNSSGSQTYSGTTASLRLSGAGTLTLGAGTNIVNSGMICNAGGAFTHTITGGDLTSGGGHGLIFIQGDSAFNTVVNSNIVDNGATSVPVTLAQLKAVVLNGNNSYTGSTFLVRNGEAGSNSAFGTGTIVFAGGFLSANTGVALANAVSTVNTAGTITGAQNITLTGNISGANGLTVNNTGVTTLSGDNSGLTAAITIAGGATGGKLALGSATAAGTVGVGMVTGSTVSSADTAARSVKLSSFGAGVTNNGLIFGLPGTGALTVTHGAMGASAYLFTINNGVTTFASTQASGSGASFTKAGPGKMVISGLWTMTNLPAGGVNITEGSLQLDVDDFGGGGLTFGGTTGTLTSAAGTNLILNPAGEWSMRLPITGPVSLSHVGPGRTIIRGANSYSGPTTITAGTLQIGNNDISAPSGSLGTGPVVNNATLVFKRPDEITVANAISGSGDLVQEGDGTTTLTGTLSFTGNTMVSAGVLSLAAASLADTSTVSIFGTGILELTHGAIDDVATLILDGVPQPVGTYHSGNTDGLIIGTGSIRVVGGGGNDYGTWAATNAGGQPANLDFDLDGISNGVEYFMGSPTGFTANPGVVSGKVTWPKSATFSGTYVVQTSNDLTIWNTATSGVVDSGGSVEYTLPTGAGRIFARLKVTPN